MAPAAAASSSVFVAGANPVHAAPGGGGGLSPQGCCSCSACFDCSDFVVAAVCMLAGLAGSRSFQADFRER